MGQRDDLESKRSPARLLALDGFEQGLEVSLAKALRSAPLNDLEEESRPVLDRLGENLEQIALIIAINQDTQFGQFAQVFPDCADPFGQHLVVGRRYLEE